MVALQEKRQILQDWYNMVYLHHPTPAVFSSYPAFKNKSNYPKKRKKWTTTKNTTLWYLNTALGVNDAVLLPLAHRTVSCYFLCQHRTWTLVKCFESEPGTNFFFASFPSLFLFVLKSFESTVSDWDIDVLLAGPL